MSGGPTFYAYPRHEGDWWVIDVYRTPLTTPVPEKYVGAGLTARVRDLADAEPTVRELIAAILGCGEQAFGVSVGAA